EGGADRLGGVALLGVTAGRHHRGERLLDEGDRRRTGGDVAGEPEGAVDVDVEVEEGDRQGEGEGEAATRAAATGAGDDLAGARAGGAARALEDVGAAARREQRVGDGGEARREAGEVHRAARLRVGVGGDVAGRLVDADVGRQRGDVDAKSAHRLRAVDGGEGAVGVEAVRTVRRVRRQRLRSAGDGGAGVVEM